jgi:hypothetical protein
MAVAVAERVESLCTHFHKLMEHYSSSVTAAVLMRRYLEMQGPVYPPHVSRFQSWMRSHLLRASDCRRNRLALR